jgi:hypothetical protein
VSSGECRSALSTLLPGLNTLVPNRRPFLAVHAQSSADPNRQNIPQTIKVWNVRSEPAYVMSAIDDLKALS